VGKKKKSLAHYTQVGLVLIVFSLAVTLLAHYSVLLSTSFQTGRLQREITALNKEQHQLKLEVSRLSSLDRIEAIARQDLGMVYPRPGQYITLTLKR
jgi:cell division protein FtsL